MNDWWDPYQNDRERDDAARIDRICDAFERAWHEDKSYLIEDILSEIDDRLHAIAIPELIQQELDLRFNDGETLDRIEYILRFPDYGEAIELAFKKYDEDDTAGNSESGDEESENGETSFDLNQPDPETMPSEIGPYHQIKKIDQGGFGVVYSAVDRRNEKRVALKFPRKDGISTPQERQSLIDEATAAQALEHKGIVPTYGVESTDDRLFIVQKLIEGGTLRARLQSRLPLTDGVLMIAEIAEVLAFAHHRGFIHRDIKPSNILLDSSNNVYVADFGLTIHENTHAD